MSSTSESARRCLDLVANAGIRLAKQATIRQREQEEFRKLVRANPKPKPNPNTKQVRRKAFPQFGYTITPELLDQANALQAEGKSYKEIAIIIQRAPSAVWKRLNSPTNK